MRTEKTSTSLLVCWLAAVAGCDVGSTRVVVESSSSELVKCKDGEGWCVEPFWDGGYNCIDNSCHDAANEGVDNGNDGILSCHGFTDGPYGHTINWDVPEPGTICILNPQKPGKGQDDGAVCCWDGTVPESTNAPRGRGERRWDLVAGAGFACALL